MDGIRMIERLQRDAFLYRLTQVTANDPSVRVRAAVLGGQLGLPLERTLDIVDDLHAAGLVHRCGKLLDGAPVHLTAAGVEEGPRFAA